MHKHTSFLVPFIFHRYKFHMQEKKTEDEKVRWSWGRRRGNPDHICQFDVIFNMCVQYNVHLDCFCLFHFIRKLMRTIIIAVLIVNAHRCCRCRCLFEANLNRFLSLWHICKLNNYTHSNIHALSLCHSFASKLILDAINSLWIKCRDKSLIMSFGVPFAIRNVKISSDTF